MIFTRIYYQEDCHSNAIDDSSSNDDVPAKEVWKVSIFDEGGRQHCPSMNIEECDCEQGASLLRPYPAKIPMVHVNCRQEESSPEYLKLLVSILSKAESLEIDFFDDDAAYACFMACMLQQNCLRKLDIGRFDTSMTAYQAKLLFEGVAFCHSLEELTLRGSFEEPEEALKALAKALRRNYNLKTFELHLKDTERDYGNIFHAAIADTRMHDISIYQTGDHGELPFDVMTEVLCTDKCTVKRIALCGVEPTARAQSEESMQNTSVTYYSLTNVNIDCFRVMETISLFKGIKELCLYENRISDLSPLDPLLIGDHLTLETLHLDTNEISENDAIEFFRKMPKMTCLRKVALERNPFIDASESWKDIAREFVPQNRSLECVNCIGDHYVCDQFPEFHVPLSLNRGGRRALELESSEPLPVNLWPHVLERASKLSYFRASDLICDDGSLDSTRPDVVYWLLKEKMLESFL